MSMPNVKVRGQRSGSQRSKQVLLQFGHFRQGAFLWWWPSLTMCAGPSIFMATTGDVRIIPAFRIWGCVLHLEHISCVITNWSQNKWAIHSLFSVALKALLEEDITRKLLSLSLYSCLSLFSHYFLPVCYCSMWLNFSRGISCLTATVKMYSHCPLSPKKR